MKKIIALTRPFTLGHTVIIALMYCLIAQFSFEKAILATFSMVAIHASAQMTNLIHDVQIDAINKPWRPLVTGEVVRWRAILFDIACAIAAFITAWFVSPHFFMWMFVLAFFAWTFSLTPVRKNQFTHVLWMAMTRGFLPAYMITANLPIALMMWLWNWAFNPVKDYKDVKGDLKFGIKTIANQYGKIGLKKWCMFWGLLFYVVLQVFIIFGLLPIRAAVLIVTIFIAATIPEALDEPPAFSDNNMAYDLYWFGFTLNAVFLTLVFLS